MKPENKRAFLRKKEKKQKRRQEVILGWLKPYLETKADNEASKIWDQLRMYGNAMNWKKFAHVIRTKWLSVSPERANETICLDDSNHCCIIWYILKDEVSVRYADAGISANDVKTEDAATIADPGVPANDADTEGTVTNADLGSPANNASAEFAPANDGNTQDTATNATTSCPATQFNTSNATKEHGGKSSLSSNIKVKR